MHNNLNSPTGPTEQSQQDQQIANRRAAAAAEFPVGSTIIVRKRSGRVVRHDHKHNLSVEFENGTRKTIDPLKLQQRFRLQQQ